jgi:type VI secretion system protein VasG
MAVISRVKLFGRLNVLTYKALEGALAFCQLRGNLMVEPAHWLHQIAQAPDSDFKRILRACDLDEGAVASDIVASLGRLPRGQTTMTDFSEHISHMIQEAFLYGVFEHAHASVRSGHLILAHMRSPSLAMLTRDLSPRLAAVKGDVVAERFASIVAGSPEDAMASADGQTPAVIRTGDPTITGTTASGESALAKFSVDLTEKARKGEIDNVVGRDDEIRKMVDILMRRRQNNPILTGEPGVGKTALAEGFAIRVANNDVPPPLRGVSVRTLDLGLLQAGASVKGEFENRLRQVIEEVQGSATPIILFIDEAHTLIGAGGAAGQNDAANLLKPALARGTLRTIAATTWSEYKQYFEKDPALTRRFQVVKVGEPDDEKCVRMLRGIIASLEKHHKVVILDEAISTAVKHSRRYIPARQLPDKAVSLLDTACARVALSQHAVPAALENVRRGIEAGQAELAVLEREAKAGADHRERLERLQGLLRDQAEQERSLEERWKRQVDLVAQVTDLRSKGDDPKAVEQLRALQTNLAEQQGDDPLVLALVDATAVSAVVADWTGVPVGKMLRSEIEGTLRIADTLEARVIGQRHALDIIADRLRVAKAGLENPSRPIGVFMLAGPSGVGKTETAYALADAMYGGTDALITINMSEFQEAHKVATLMGSPPGYVGYGKGGVLTEAVRRRPYSIVLLDEVEKAHADVHEVFFQVFDKGMMKDSEGLEIDFKNTIILLTSNVGSDTIINMCKDPALIPDAGALAEAVRPGLRKVFPDALLGRLTVVPYYPISDAMLRQIIKLQLARVGQRVRAAHRAEFVADDSVLEAIASRCKEVESGARIVESIIMRSILPKMSRELLEARASGKNLRTVSIGVADSQFTCSLAE